MAPEKENSVKIATTCLSAALGIISAPIWYYLLYQVLDRVEASTAMWVAYWVYVPIALLGVLVSSLLKAISDQEERRG